MRTFDFWKWTTEQRLMSRAESLSAPFYAHVLRKPSRHYFSDARFYAISGYCSEVQFFWRYTIDPQVCPENKRSKSREITMNLLELCGTMITAFVVQILLVDRPTSEGESVVMRGVCRRYRR